MDSQAQLQRTHGHQQAEEPIKIHHPEEEGHHEKGPSKVLKKVKEKAKKIKNVLTKHGHGHEHGRGEHIPDDHDLDQEDDEDDDYQDQQLHGGAPARGKAHIPVKEEIVPPGTKAFPVVSSSHTKHSDPTRGVGHEAVSHPVRPSGVPDKEERRGAATLTPHNTPVSLLSATEDVTRTFVPGEDKSRDQRKVNMERPRGLEQDPAAPGSHGGMSNYQSKVTDPTGKATGEIGAATTVSALGRLGLGTDLQKKSHGLDTKSAAPGSHGGMSTYQSKVTDPTGKAAGEQPSVAAFGRRKETGEDDQLGLGRDLREKSHGFDTKSRPEMGKHLPAGDVGSRLRKESPEKSHEFDLGKDLPTRTQGIKKPEGFDSKGQERGDEMQQPNQSSYTDKIALATSVVADKAVAAKTAVASKLGYPGEAGHENRVEGAEPPSSAGGYGSTVAGMVTPVYEKVKETGASVMTKLPFSGTGTEQGQDKGVSAKEYLTEKLSPGEEDKALSEVVAEKLHLGGGGGEPKKGIVTQSEEVEKRLGGFKDPSSEAATKQGEAYAEEGEGGMAEKLRGAVTSWLAGTTEEVTKKSTESVQDSTQSLGSTVGNKMGISGSGGDEAGNGGSVPLQRRFQESGK
ncbi:CAP160 protein [Arabidopsis suecica]|uniref:CAP160 protein n=1 Tax=Arabidopsis suecica TaxID=45249 RepID=A0A8T1YJJ3_ARASU|nr:CAP160 protein [Arabidopsis suecica]